MYLGLMMNIDLLNFNTYMTHLRSFSIIFSSFLTFDLINLVDFLFYFDLILIDLIEFNSIRFDSIDKRVPLNPALILMYLQMTGAVICQPLLSFKVLARNPQLKKSI